MATREHVVDDDKQLRQFLANHPLHKWHGKEHAYRLEEYIDSITSANFELKNILGPFDSIINHFPMSKREFREEAIRYIQNRIGRYLGRIISSKAWYQKWYPGKRSKECKRPGRLFSFIALKKS